jgi:hypothetical protein
MVIRQLNEREKVKEKVILDPAFRRISNVLLPEDLARRLRAMMAYR